MTHDEERAYGQHVARMTNKELLDAHNAEPWPPVGTSIVTHPESWKWWAQNYEIVKRGVGLVYSAKE